MTETERAVIINTNLAFGMILGLMNGPLLKICGYRKVAIVGCLIFSLGVTLTAFATSFLYFLIFYGLLSSIGLSMTMASYSLAVNSYFAKRRGRAMGLALTITGLGSICMPQLATILLNVYGIQGTVLLLGGYSLHALIAAMFLQPIKRHMKSVPLCLETINENPEIISNISNEGDYNSENDANAHNSKLVINNNPRKRKITLSSISYDVETGSIYGIDSLPQQMSIDGTMSCQPSMTNLHDGRKSSKHSWRNAAKSTESINLGSSMKIFDEFVPLTKKQVSIEKGAAKVNKSNDVINQSIFEVKEELEKMLKEAEKEKDDCFVKENSDSDEENELIIRRILRRMVDMFDFEILRDPIYLNIMLGMAIAFFAEVNFSLLTPIILYEMGMTTAENANTMSVIAAVDLISRGLAPYLGEWLRQPPRMMYIISLICLMISRLALLVANSYGTLMLVAIGLGAAKGIRTVYMLLVMPSYIPLQKLPNATSIQMLTNGIFLICGGPILGIIRDASGSYKTVNILINGMTAITIIMWTVEVIIRRRSARRKSNMPVVP